jgi:dinuclear metal center YbgI/SA1388 family protein
MNRIAPPALAMEGDPVGLQAGRRRTKVSTALLALDVLPATVEEAKRRGAELLITHHPAFYRGLRTLDEERCKGALAAMILRDDLTVFSAHTNLDIAPGGVADSLADAVGMEATRHPLEITGTTPYLKLAVFVPKNHLHPVQKAICDAGAGRYGAYSNCTFQVTGMGTFQGDETADPFIGTRGILEQVEEVRLETRVLATDQRAVTSALLKAHPYEVPAYEFYRLEESEPYGLGRVGELTAPTTVAALAQHLATTLKAPGVQCCGPKKKRVARVAVVSGHGAPIARAARAGADVLITGECSYHDAEEAEFFKLPLIRLGHGASERLALAPLAQRLRKAVPGLKVLLSRDRATPFANVVLD